MTPDKVREHNESCDDDDIIWCECSKCEPVLLACKNCGGAVEGIVMYVKNVPNGSITIGENGRDGETPQAGG